MSIDFIYGVNYSPTWPAWEPGEKNSGPDAQMSDSDFYNISYRDMWKSRKVQVSGKGVVAKGDIETMASDCGFQLLRAFNWNSVRGCPDCQDHISFLDELSSNNMLMIVPISNYFLSSNEYAWGNVTGLSSFSFDAAPQNIQDALTNFVKSIVVKSTGAVHSAVHSIAVGNELDYNNMISQGGPYVAPGDRAYRTLWWIINLREKLKVLTGGDTVKFTAPISNADQGADGNCMNYWFQVFVNGVAANKSHLPFGTTLDGSVSTGNEYFTSCTFSGLNSISDYTDWYYNSVNIYQTGTGLTTTIGQYDKWQSTPNSGTNWPGQQFSVPLMLTEIGHNTTSNEDRYNVWMSGIAEPIRHYLNSKRHSLLMGMCVYEYSNEKCLGANQDHFGFYEYNESDSCMVETGTTNVGYATWPSMEYPLIELDPYMNSSGTESVAQSVYNVISGISVENNEACVSK